LSPVKNRWFSPESLSALPTVSNLFSPETFVSGPIDTLSNLHWDIFHDVQLLERCYRRSADAYSQLDVVENKEISSQECLISDHCEWSLLISTVLQKSVRSILTPAVSV
jgi:exportin-5